MAANSVVIVGGGPSGLMCALLLARQGVQSILLERTLLKPRAPKAHVINPRSLEIARAADLDVARMHSEATPAADDKWSVFMTTLTGTEVGRLPFERHDDTHTPLPRINLAQPLFEQILLEEIGSNPSIDLRLGHRWMSADETPDAVISTVSNPDGSTYTVSSPYLLGADGANSRVREMLGVELAGPADVSRCLTIHFEANLRALVHDRPAMFYWTLAATIPGIFIAYDIERTWAYLSLTAPEQTPSTAEAVEHLQRAIGRTDVELSVRHVIPWSLAGRVATRYQSDRTFLVGDACHNFPPAGGLGMNTGIQDAHNLAWKLAGVINGWADPWLLHSYESERRPVAIRNTEQSLKNAEGMPAVFALSDDSSPEQTQAAIDGMFDNFNSLTMQIGYTYSGQPNRGNVSSYVPSAEIGDRMPHAWIRPANRGTISSLDLLNDRRYTLLTCSLERHWQLADTRIPLDVVRIPSEWDVPDHWLDVMELTGDDCAVLVRPDGHIESRVHGDAHAIDLQLTGRDIVERTASPS